MRPTAAALGRVQALALALALAQVQVQVQALVSVLEQARGLEQAKAQGPERALVSEQAPVLPHPPASRPAR